jgi:hypothetical protein
LITENSYFFKLLSLKKNSYVQLDGRFKQICGIPMGINPAVYMANFYLYHYERSFLQRLLDLYQRACEGAGHRPSRRPVDWDTVDIVTLLSEPPGLSVPSGANAAQDWHLWGQAALFLMHQFQVHSAFC